MKVTEALLAEHAVFHNLFDHIESTLPRTKTLAEIRALTSLLQALLEGHAKVEDALLFEPLEHCIAQLGQQETFHQEHEEIDKNLREALRRRSVRVARSHLLAAVAASRHHFDTEERILFPMAETILKAGSLKTLGDSWMKQRQDIVEPSQP